MVCSHGPFRTLPEVDIESRRTTRLEQVNGPPLLRKHCRCCRGYQEKAGCGTVSASWSAVCEQLPGGKRVTASPTTGQEPVVYCWCLPLAEPSRKSESEDVYLLASSRHVNIQGVRAQCYRVQNGSKEAVAVSRVTHVWSDK